MRGQRVKPVDLATLACPAPAPPDQLMEAVGISASRIAAARELIKD